MRRTLQVTGSLVIMGLLLGALVLVFGVGRGTGGPLRMAQQPYPPPQTPTVGAYPGPITPSPTSMPTPTPTPFWSPTPRPVPTRRPGPTVTPYPTLRPAPNAAGMILYAPPHQPTILGLPVDEQGRKAGEMIPLPLSLGFKPLLGPPSPDGHYLIVLQPVEPSGIPYVFDWQTQSVWPLLRGHPMQPQIAGWPYDWHPDGRHVLFWVFNNEELWLVDAETGEYVVLALTEGPVQGATISPNGQQIVYIHRNGATEAMWKVSADGGDARLLLELQGPSYVFGWSPDGRYILYAGGSSVSFKGAMAGTPVSEGPLWLADPEGQIRKPLSGRFLFGWGFEPKWSPDGQWIAFTGLDEGRRFGCSQKDSQVPGTCMFEGTGIYTENVRTGEIRRLASGIEPVWSPDGLWIAFLSNQSGAPEIWVVRADGTELRQLTTDAQPKGWKLVWAPVPR